MCKSGKEEDEGKGAQEMQCKGAKEEEMVSGARCQVSGKTKLGIGCQVPGVGGRDTLKGSGKEWGEGSIYFWWVVG
jgi:hypothetical protein